MKFVNSEVSLTPPLLLESNKKVCVIGFEKNTSFVIKLVIVVSKSLTQRQFE